MAEELHDFAQWDSLCEEQRGGAMPQVVESTICQIRFTQDALEIIVEKLPLDGMAIRHRENEPMILPCRSNREPFGGLALPMSEQSFDYRLR